MFAARLKQAHAGGLHEGVGRGGESFVASGAATWKAHRLGISRNSWELSSCVPLEMFGHCSTHVPSWSILGVSYLHHFTLETLGMWERG